MKKAFKRKTDIAPVVIIPALLVFAALLALAACGNPTGDGEVTLTFNANGGTPEPAAQTLAGGAKAAEPAAMTKSGYAFGGWYKDPALTTAWNFATDTVTADSTLYAKWTESLANTVWGGETPRAGDWLTISFKDLDTAIAGSEETGLRAIWSFSIDNSTNNWGYAYDAETRTGTIASSGWNPAPDGFAISEDRTTLTITHYGSHTGNPREFKRLRDSEGTVAIAPEPIAAPTHLAGSVWAGETPRAGDWLAISFKDIDTAIAGSDETGLRSVWSFSIDNSTNNWGYAYDAATRTGTITATGWHPAPDGFAISEDGTTLTITHYGSHAGDPREFKRLRAPDAP